MGRRGWCVRFIVRKRAGSVALRGGLAPPPRCLFARCSALFRIRPRYRGAALKRGFDLRGLWAAMEAWRLSLFSSGERSVSLWRDGQSKRVNALRFFVGTRHGDTKSFINSATNGSRHFRPSKQLWRQCEARFRH